MLRHFQGISGPLSTCSTASNTASKGGLVSKISEDTYSLCGSPLNSLSFIFMHSRIWRKMLNAYSKMGPHQP